MIGTIAVSLAAVVFVALCSVRAGGFWRFAKRACATGSGWLFALSEFCSLMDHASETWFGMVAEAIRATAKAAGENRRAALAEMGERA
jgi:hypothetical protein